MMFYNCYFQNGRLSLLTDELAIALFTLVNTNLSA